MLAGLLLAGCSQSTTGSIDWSSRQQRAGIPPGPRLVPWDQPVPRGGGTAKLGQPYQIFGRWYVPRDEPNYDSSGTASWYGADAHGRPTANGEIFDMGALSAAHTTLPLPSYVTVTNIANNRTVLVRVNDRGPYVHDRLIDVSRRAAEALGFAGMGVANVRVRYAGPAPLDGKTSREEAYLRQQPWFGTIALASAAPTRPARRWPGGVRPSGLGGDMGGDAFDDLFMSQTPQEQAWRAQVFQVR